MSQVTHVNDTSPDGNRYLRQVVTPAELRRILRRDGESIDRPADFGPLDEWDVDSDLT